MNQAATRRRIVRRALAPLEPDAFLRWAFKQMAPADRPKGFGPLSLDDVWFELVHRDPEITRAQVRKDYVRLAAKVRRNQRRGLMPFEGLG